MRARPSPLAWGARLLRAILLLLHSQLRRRGSLQLLVEASLALGVAFSRRWRSRSRSTATEQQQAERLEDRGNVCVGVAHGSSGASRSRPDSRYSLPGLAYGESGRRCCTAPPGPVIANSRYLCAVLVSAAGLICAATLDARPA